MSALGVNVKRGLQTLAVTCYCLTFIAGPASYFLFAYLLFYTNLYWLPLAYFAYCFGEREISTRGGRPFIWVQRWSWWVYIRDYFSMELVKTTDLDPQKNHLICVFPHGIFSFGASIAFSSEALDVGKLFPGIRPSVIVLPQDYKLPILRELMLSMGTCSSSKESLNYLMNDPEGGRAAVLLVGGSAESLSARARTYKLVLKERKGFVKIALRNGSSLVPAFSFGENEMYDQWANPKGSWVRRYQDLFRKVTGVAPVVPLGRGIFQNSFGFIPKRTPIHVVVGAPITVEKALDPSQEQIDSLHRIFIENLTTLFEQHKHKYIEDADDVKLVFV